MVLLLEIALAEGKGVSAPYEHLQSDRYLGSREVETRIVENQFVTEGPVVDRAGDVYFTNIPTAKILKWNPNGKTLTELRTHSGNPNGLRFAMNEDLLSCEVGSGRVTRTHMAYLASEKYHRSFCIIEASMILSIATLALLEVFSSSMIRKLR